MWRWLQPGLGLKRWAALIVFSGLVLGAGIVLLIGTLVRPDYDASVLWLTLVSVGGLGLVLGISGLVYSVASRTHTGNRSLYRTLKRKTDLMYGPRVVVIGGGTGLATLLRGLKRMTDNLTAIVTVTDDGGSSGRLRRQFGLPAPGDLRSCLAALAPEEARLSELVSYRFDNGDDLAGHSLGNLLLTALTDLHGGFPEAIRECSEVLAIQGRVLPSMLGSPELRARLQDGEVVRGETSIADSELPVAELEVHPNPARANPEALAAVMEAELIVVGPGSLYTSILANFLEPELCEAIVTAEAPLVYVCNLMTQPGETEDYSVSDHLDAFRTIPPHSVAFDHVLVNTRLAPPEIRRDYEEEGAQQVMLDYEEIRSFECEVHPGDYLTVGEHLRHDPRAVWEVLEDLLQRHVQPDGVA